MAGRFTIQPKGQQPVAKGHRPLGIPEMQKYENRPTSPTIIQLSSKLFFLKAAITVLIWATTSTNRCII